MTEIFKVQFPIPKWPGPLRLDVLKLQSCLAHNEDRSVQDQLPITDDLIDIMDGRLKAYFYGRVENKKLVLDALEEAPEQDW